MEKTLEQHQETLTANTELSFYNDFIKERTDIINNLWYKKRVKGKVEKVFYSDEDKEPYFYSGEKLTEFMVRYAKIALVIHPIIDEYNRKSFNSCVECPALNICRICYASSYSNSEFDIGKKEMECESYIETFLKDLALYSYVNKHFPEITDEW